MNNQVPISLRVVEKSILTFKMQERALLLFDSWKNYWQEKYPEYPFKADLEKLERELKEQFSKALESLFEQEHAEDRKIPGWSEGFVYGFIASSLSTQWCYEYIYTKTKEYKELMFLKSIIEYFNVDVDALHRIGKLYSYLINGKIDLCDRNYDLNSKVVDFDELADTTDPDKVFFNFFTSYLESIILEKHYIAFQKILDNNFCPDLEDCFTKNEIKSIIDSYAIEIKDFNK